MSGATIEIVRSAPRYNQDDSVDQIGIPTAHIEMEHSNHSTVLGHENVCETRGRRWFLERFQQFGLSDRIEMSAAPIETAHPNAVSKESGPWSTTELSYNRPHTRVPTFMELGYIFGAGHGKLINPLKF